MSEKFAERPAGRPAEREASDGGPGTALDKRAEVALSPAARADAEIEALDREMDGILGKPNHDNRKALMNRPEQALQPQGGGLVTPSVAPPVEAGSINHLVMNAIIPGLGSLAHGKKALGLAQLAMALAALPTLFFNFWAAVLLAVFAYAWSVVSGIGFLSDKNTPTWK